MTQIIVGVPCPRQLDASWVSEIVTWEQGSAHHDVGFVFERTPNRMDWSISGIIDAVLRTDAEWLCLNDADVIPEIPFDAAAYYARKNLSELGFGVSASICRSVEGSYSLRPLDPRVTEVSREEPVEVSFVTGGHWWIHRKILESLKPVSYLTLIGGAKRNIYIAIPEHTTEDADMCERFRARAHHICADPRLLTVHLKTGRLPSYRAGMPVGKVMPGGGTSTPMSWSQVPKVIERSKKEMEKGR